MVRRLLLLALAPGCGLGLADDSSGGHSNLPGSAAGPYKRLETDLSTPNTEPFVLASRTESFSDPDCQPRDGGGFRCWFTYVRDADGRSTIGYAELGDLHQPPEVGPTMVFSGGGVVSSPALAPGPSGTTLLFHQIGDDDAPSIGFASSFDGGHTFTDAAATGLNGTSPAVAYVDGVYHLYFAENGAIWHASGTDPAGLDVDPTPAIEPRPDLADAFDARAVGDPAVYVSTSDAGRHTWGLLFTGEGVGRPGQPDAGAEGAPTAIGYAGSFDGVTWERFNGPDPVLTAPATGPCVVAEGPSTVLFYAEEQRLHLGVGAARP